MPAGGRIAGKTQMLQTAMGVPTPQADDLHVVVLARGAWPSRRSRPGRPGCGGQLQYSYDFGDGWEHDVSVEKVTAPQPGTRYPSCVAGRQARPSEDVGGPWGYQEFLAGDPKHDEHDSGRSGSAAPSTRTSSTS